MAYFRKIYTCEEVPHRAKMVYMYLCDRCDSQNKTFPSVPTIAKDLSISVMTVRRAISDLEKAELIRKEYAYRSNGSCTSNRYYIL